MRIALCATRNWYHYMRVLIHSIKKYHPDAELWCFVQDDNVDGIDANFINIEKIETPFSEDNPNCQTRYTSFTLIRCYMSKILPEEIDKILYLDIDTLLVGPIDKLWNIDITNYYGAGAQEPKKSIDYPYINAGVFLMNLKKIREDKKDDEWIRMLNEKVYQFPDQDVINLSCRGKIKLFSSKYNANPYTNITDNDIIIHYAYKKGWCLGTPRNEFWFKEEQELIEEEDIIMLAVGIPVYHSRETLPRALDSLVLQTKKMFMVIIVNDADGEDYSDIINEYKKRGLKITYVEQEKNMGPGMARQRMINMASRMCKYIMFLDSDDMYAPIAVEVMSRAIQQEDLDIVMGNTTQLITGQPAFRAEVEQTSVTWVWNKIYKISYLLDNNICFPEELRVSEDIAFSLPAWNCTEKHERINQDIYYWCDNKNSLTRCEGKTEFDKKNIADFVKAQCLGLKKIKAISEHLEDQLIIGTLRNIYSQVQLAIQLGASEDDYIEELKSLKEFPETYDWMKNKQAWGYLLNTTRCGAETDKGDIVFFKERFIDWFKRCFEDE